MAIKFDIQVFILEEYFCTSRTISCYKTFLLITLWTKKYILQYIYQLKSLTKMTT